MTQAVIQTTVTGMQGRPIATTVPANNQTYTWSGSAWTPTGPYLPLAGGVLTGALRIQYASPVQIFNDTGTSITAGGLWREANSGGNLSFQSNTATAGDFSTAVTPLQLGAGGAVTVGATLSVNGTGNFAGVVNVGGAFTAAGVTATGSASAVNIGATGIISAGNGAQAGVITIGTVLNNNGVRYNGVNGPNFVAFQWTGAAGVFNTYVDGSFVGNLTPQGSDPRLKTNIAAVSVDPLAIINQMTMQQFTFTLPIEDAAPQHWSVGFMADQLFGLIPEAVNKGDGTITFDTVNSLPLIAYLVAGEQRLVAMIQQLQASVGALQQNANQTVTAWDTV